MKRGLVPCVVLGMLASCASIPLDTLPQRDLVTLGDSVTMGVGAGGQGPDLDCFDAFTGANAGELLGKCNPAKWIDRSAAYPYLTAKWLGVKHANFALAGHTAADVAKLQVSLAAALRPRYVTLFVGANDLIRGRDVEAFAADLEFILGRLGETDARVFVLNLPDVWRAPRFVEKPDDDVTPKRVAAFNAATAAAVAAHKGAVLVDISGPELATPEMFSTDGFHLGPLAHRVMADKVLAAINSREAR